MGGGLTTVPVAVEEPIGGQSVGVDLMIDHGACGVVDDAAGVFQAIEEIGLFVLELASTLQAEFGRKTADASRGVDPQRHITPVRIVGVAVLERAIDLTHFERAQRAV